jgi:ribosome-associated protein
VADEYDEDGLYRPSRTELRAERKLVQAGLDALAKRLAAASPKTLDALDLDDATYEAVRTLATLSKGPALARQRRLTARLLRAYDVEALTRRLDTVLGNRGVDPRAQTLERWRTRLLSEGDAALAELLTAHPTADGQRLRQAVRAAAAEEKKGARGRRFKELFQILGEVTMNEKAPS